MAIWDDPGFLESFKFSIVLALLASVTATTIGAMVAIALARHQFVGRETLEAFFMAPLAMPGVVLGLGLLRLFSSAHIVPSLWTLLVGHVLVTTPFAVRMVMSALANFDIEIEITARSLGASYPTLLRTVTLPIVRTGLFGAIVFTFIISFDDVSISLFLSGLGAETLPVKLYGFIEQNVTPVVDAVSAVMLLFGLVALGVIERLVGLQRAFGVE
jgi:putative spermidine/putrescine transport system permease protein